MQRAWGSSSWRAGQRASRLCFWPLLSLSCSLLLIFPSVPAVPHGLPERPHLHGPHFSHLPDRDQLSLVRFRDLGQESVARKSGHSLMNGCRRPRRGVSVGRLLQPRLAFQNTLSPAPSLQCGSCRDFEKRSMF